MSFEEQLVRLVPLDTEVLTLWGLSLFGLLGRSASRQWTVGAKSILAKYCRAKKAHLSKGGTRNEYELEHACCAVS